MAKRAIAELAKRQAELVAELSEVRAEIAARAGEVETVETAAAVLPPSRRKRKAT